MACEELKTSVLTLSSLRSLDEGHSHLIHRAFSSNWLLVRIVLVRHFSIDTWYFKDLVRDTELLSLYLSLQDAELWSVRRQHPEHCQPGLLHLCDLDCDLRPGIPRRPTRDSRAELSWPALVSRPISCGQRNLHVPLHSVLRYTGRLLRRFTSSFSVVKE